MEDWISCNDSAGSVPSIKHTDVAVGVARTPTDFALPYHQRSSSTLLKHEMLTAEKLIEFLGREGRCDDDAQATHVAEGLKKRPGALPLFHQLE